MNEDQFAEWRGALNGAPLDCGPCGEPTSGFFKRLWRGSLEAVAIWRDEEGFLRCKIYSEVKCSVPLETIDADMIDDILSSCSRYPIDYEVFKAVAYSRETWPPEYRTRLTLKEIQNGTAWTAALGRQKLAMQNAADVEREEKRAAAECASAARATSREEKRRAKVTAHAAVAPAVLLET